jgi:hypothetical protein
MPSRVKLEVERFLSCGDARFGFVEVTCEACAESRVVAFCCKGRGWCPSCTTRRALDTGVHLESVLPRVAHRQWTLSLPFSVRFNVVKKPPLLKRLEVQLVKAVGRWQRSEARRHGATGTLTGGGVCFWQWFGSGLQLTPHLHLLWAEALWQEDGTMVPVAPPGDEDVARILTRVLRAAKKDWAELEAAWPEDEYEELQQRAIQERLGLAFGAPLHHRARRLAVQDGFSLHADTAVHGHDRQALERLCRYGARGPVAESRLRRLEDGRYEYSPKKGTAFLLTAEALVRRLVALLPPPRLHLTSFHGAYAPNSRLRPLVTQSVASPPATPHCTAQPPAPVPEAPPAAPKKQPKPPRLDWAQLHQRTFGTDVLRCPCGGRRSIRAVHSTRKQAEARLTELGIALPSRVLPPSTAPPQLLLAM